MDLRLLTNNLVDMKLLTYLILFISLPLLSLAQTNQKHDSAILLDYYQNQRYADAFNYLSATYPTPPQDLKILGALAYTSQMSGHLPQAEQYYLKMMEIDTSNISVLSNLGNINNRRGNNAHAMLYYKKILKIDSTNFNVYRQLSDLSKDMGDVGSTIGYLQKANKINPLDGDAAYELGMYYLNLQQLPQADSTITKALNADTSNMVLTLGQTQIRYRQKKFEEVIALCLKLRYYGDVSASVTNMLGISYYMLKKYEECIAVLEPLEENQTDTESSWYYVAMSYKALNKQAQCVAALEKTLVKAISSNADVYYSEMADSYDKMKKLQASANAYQKALFFKESPLTLYALAVLYDEKLAYKKSAVTYFKKYIASKPPKKQLPYVDYAKSRLKVLVP